MLTIFEEAKELSKKRSPSSGAEKLRGIDEFEQFTIDLKNLAQRTIDPDVQASICRKVIKKIEVSVKGITIQYHVVANHYGVEFDQESRNLPGRSISRP